jgi:hypothetical protein
VIRAPTTTLRRDATGALFVVRADEAVYQDRIVHMGWTSTSEPGTLVRRLGVTDDIETIHARFAEHLEEMFLQSARLRPVRWDVALELAVDRLSGTGIDWWVYGSVALALRGA